MGWASGYRQLSVSGVPYDWATVFVGKQIGKISDEDIPACALDLIGSDSKEKDHLVALLANANSQDWQTVQRYLMEIVSGLTIDREWCLRVWRYAELKHLLASATTKDKKCDEDRWCYLGYALVDLWNEYAQLPDSSTMTPDWGQPSEDMLHRHNEWLKQETTSLIPCQ